MRDDICQIAGSINRSPSAAQPPARMPAPAIRRRVDFYCRAGRLHGLIALVPIIYGAYQTQQGVQLAPWYWWAVVATLAFAWLARRPPSVRVSPIGISFPDKKSPLYLWDEMCEAHSREKELDILMADGEHVLIAYRPLRKCDAARIKRIVQSQFQIMAARAKTEVPSLPVSPAMAA
jgi:hypothetical protein